MKVEVLYFDGCPNHEALLPHLRALLLAAGADAVIELVLVDDTDAAERQRFLGSPTVRVDGEDIEPGADKRTNFGINAACTRPRRVCGARRPTSGCWPRWVGAPPRRQATAAGSR